MLLFIPLIVSLVSATSVTITEPIDGNIYEGDWLSLRVFVENDNAILIRYTILLMVMLSFLFPG